MAKTKAKQKMKAVKLRQRKVVKAMIENGCSAKDAIKAAGYAPAYAHNPQKIMRTKTWQELMDEFLPESELIAVHKQLLRSKRVEKLVLHALTPNNDIEDMIKEAGCVLKKIYIFMDEKHVMFWAPNDKARTDALEMGYRLRGNFAPQKLEVSGAIKNLDDDELDQLIEEESKKIAK